MNFSQYMSAGQGGIDPREIADPGVICFEDGSCMPASEAPPIGYRNDPSGIQTPPREHLTYGDGTGGHFYYGAVGVPAARTVVPAGQGDGTGGAYPARPANPRAGMAFAQLLELIKRERANRGLKRRPGAGPQEQ